MLDKTKNIFHNANINIFASQICEALKSACESFWEQDIKIFLQGINDFRELRTEKLVKNVDFYTSQIKVDNHKPVIIRLSEGFIGEILDSTLQSNYPNFNFKQLTQLEMKILNSFCEFSYKKIKETLLNVPLSEKSEKYINLIFLILSKNEKCSKVMVSIPQDRISFAPLKKVESYSDDDFLTSNTTVRLKAGSSKITFDELQNLSPDDIIVLEESNLNKMKLISGNKETEFNIKINSSLILDLKNQDDEYEDEQ
ncbi:MAG: hypothetical protein IJW73_05430 [Candidatus Gastranaerophilales bacterium]|nr:hypothetical protein [Candidatus Gastranaerophilales bacterium]